MFKFLNFKYIIFLIVIIVFFPVFSLAAILYLEPAEGEYYQGDTFIVDLKIDVEKECVNAVKAELSFSQDVLKAVDFSQGKSILTIWLEDPEINQEKGLISFIAGIPGGFCGILAGDIGENNLLGQIIFQIKEANGEQFSAEMKFLDSSQVLLNDGLATPAELKTKKAVFTILPEKTETPREEWKKELEKDNIPPESFEIKISRDPDIFEGKYFIVFYTADKQTGVDYYEIKEGKRNWERGESPYLLKDQKLSGIIKVKAVDKAGNERIMVLEARYPIKWYEQSLAWIIIILGIVIGCILWKIRKIKFKARNPKS